MLPAYQYKHYYDELCEICEDATVTLDEREDYGGECGTCKKRICKECREDMQCELCQFTVCTDCSKSCKKSDRCDHSEVFFHPECLAEHHQSRHSDDKMCGNCDKIVMLEERVEEGGECASCKIAICDCCRDFMKCYACKGTLCGDCEKSCEFCPKHLFHPDCLAEHGRSCTRATNAQRKLQELEESLKCKEVEVETIKRRFVELEEEIKVTKKQKVEAEEEVANL